MNPGSFSKSGCYGHDQMSTDLRLPSDNYFPLPKVYSYLNRSQLKSNIFMYLKLLSFYKWNKEKLSLDDNCSDIMMVMGVFYFVLNTEKTLLNL